MQKIPVINGLRGIAVITIVLRHIFAPAIRATTGMVTTGIITLYPLAPVFASNEAVRLFFVLSGFVLTLPYAAGRRHMGSIADAGSFYARRARRLLPLLIVVLLVAVCMQSSSVSSFIHGLWTNVRAMVIFTEAVPRPPANPPLWSLRVEIWFSLLLPILLWCRRFVDLRLQLLIVFVVANVAIGIYTLIAVPHARWIIENTVPARLADFVTGMCVAECLASGKRLPHARLITWFSFAALLTFFTLIQYSSAHAANLLLIAANPGMDAAYGLLILSLVMQPDSIPARFCTWKPLQAAGIMCYSIYAWHALFLRRPFDVRSGGPLYIGLYLLLVGVVGLVSWRYIECGFSMGRSDQTAPRVKNS